MGFIYLRNDKGDLERVHTSFLANAVEIPNEDVEHARTGGSSLLRKNEAEKLLRVTHTADGSAVIHLGENLAYEVYPNGDLVVILKEVERTVFREFGMQDLAFPTPK